MVPKTEETSEFSESSTAPSITSNGSLPSQASHRGRLSLAEVNAQAEVQRIMSEVRRSTPSNESHTDTLKRMMNEIIQARTDIDVFLAQETLLIKQASELKAQRIDRQERLQTLNEEWKRMNEAEDTAMEQEETP